MQRIAKNVKESSEPIFIHWPIYSRHAFARTTCFSFIRAHEWIFFYLSKKRRKL